MTDKKHFCIVDGSGFMHRARGIAPSSFRRKDNMDVGVANLFAKMIRNMSRRAYAGRTPPTHWAVMFDPPREDSWRRAVHPGYKAHREEPEQSFVDQIPLMRECCAAAGFSVIKTERHEADDLLAAYGMDAHSLGHKVTLITSDKDLMQLVQPGLLLWDPRSDKWYNQEAVEAKFEIPPSMLADYLALAGDVADGIPGAKGIGPKAAVGILTKAGTLQQVLENPDLIENKRWKKLVSENREELILAARLVALDITDCPRPLSLEDMIVDRPDLIEGRITVWMQQNTMN
jgi:DNA polymerase-1